MREKTSVNYHISELRSKISNLNITLNSNIFVLKKIKKIKMLYNDIKRIITQIFLIRNSFYDYDFFIELYDILKNIEFGPLKQSGIYLHVYQEYNCKTISLVYDDSMTEEINIYTGRLVKIKMGIGGEFLDHHITEIQFCDHISKNSSNSDLLEGINSSLVIFYSLFSSYLDYITPSTFKIIMNSFGGKKNEISN